MACVLALRDGVVPPTANLNVLDPQCPVDVIRGAARELPVRVAVNNAFGFGGNTACTVFTRPDFSRPCSARPVRTTTPAGSTR